MLPRQSCCLCTLFGRGGCHVGARLCLDESQGLLDQHRRTQTVVVGTTLTVSVASITSPLRVELEIIGLSYLHMAAAAAAAAVALLAAWTQGPW